MRRFGLWSLLGCLLAAPSAQSQTLATTALTLSADTISPSARQVIHLSAAVSAATNVTGTVTFFDGTKVLAIEPVNPQGATYLGVASLTAGSHTLTAAYSGDAASAPSSSSLAISVSGIPVLLTVTDTPASPYANSLTTLAGLGLPADATGTLTFSDGSSTIASAAISGTSSPHSQAFGDSITAAANVSDPSQRYVNQIASTGGYLSGNYAATSAIACDLLPYQILANGLGPTQASSPLSSVMIGANDLDLHTAQPYEPIFEQCHQAALAWLAIPREYKVLPTDSAVSVVSGTWTSDSTTYHTLFNSSGSGTARFNLTTTGQPVYLWYLLSDQHNGSFTITLDGVPTGQSYSTQPSTPINSSNSPSIGYALVRLPATQGPHTVDLTAQSGSVGILAVATPPSPALASVHPTVLATDVPSQLATNPAAPAAAIAAYTQDIQNDVALLAGDGLDVRFVPTQPFMQGSAAEMSDQVNPNALGQTHLAQAFASALADVSTSPFVTFSNLAPAANASFANSGNHIMTAAYSGDSIYAPATATININVLPQASTSTTLATPVTHASFGTPVALSATVSPTIATGTVTFFDGTQFLAQLSLSNGAATFTSSNLSVGVHTLLASYSGDAADSASASPQLAIEIEPAPTTLTLAPLPATAIYGAATTLSASITPAYATGTVTFFDNGILLGSPTLTGGAASITTTLAVGQHSLFAQYSGDPNHLPTSSAPWTITIQPTVTAVTLSSIPPSANYGSVLTVTANVTPSSATGKVDFLDNTSASIAQATLSNGAANASINTFILGTHSITAFYAGDSTHAQSSSQPAITQIVPAPTTTTLAALPATIDAGTSLFLTAQINPTSATGTVLFRDQIAGTLGQAPVVRGIATLTLSTLPVAIYNITARYSGDTVDAPSASSPEPTRIILSPTSITLALPATALYATPDHVERQPRSHICFRRRAVQRCLRRAGNLAPLQRDSHSSARQSQHRHPHLSRGLHRRQPERRSHFLRGQHHHLRGSDHHYSYACPDKRPGGRPPHLQCHGNEFRGRESHRHGNHPLWQHHDRASSTHQRE